MQNHIGLLMRRDSPLSKETVISREKLQGLPLIVSRQMLTDKDQVTENLNIVGTYNLLFNGSLMVDEGLGYALCLDKIINVSGDSHLCFRPLEPEAPQTMCVIWKKYQAFPKAAEKFLLKMQEMAK